MMSREMTNSEAISNLNHIYGIVSPDIQRSLDVAIKALEERPKGEWIKWNFKTFGAMGDWEYKCSNCEKVYGGEYNFCPNCGSIMKDGEGE